MLHVSNKHCFAYDDQEELNQHEKEMKEEGYLVSNKKHASLAFYREFKNR